MGTEKLGPDVVSRGVGGGAEVGKGTGLGVDAVVVCGNDGKGVGLGVGSVVLGDKVKVGVWVVGVVDGSDCGWAPSPGSFEPCARQMRQPFEANVGAGRQGPGAGVRPSMMRGLKFV